MSGNSNGTSAELQPNKNTEDINFRKNKENMSNEEQYQKKKNKNRVNHGLTVLTDHQKSFQTVDSEWILMVNNMKRKNIKRPFMED